MNLCSLSVCVCLVSATAWGAHAPLAAAQSGGAQRSAGEVRTEGVVRARPELSQIVSGRHGGRLIALLVSDGDRVNAGDPVAEIDSPDLARLVFDLRRLELDHGALRAELSEAEARVQAGNLRTIALGAIADIADEELMRLRELGDVVGRDEMNAARTEAIERRHAVQLATADLEQARRDVQNRRDRLAAMLRAAVALREVIGPQVALPGPQGQWAAELDRPHVIRLAAPIGGIVKLGDVVVGGGVSAGQPVARITDLSSVRIEIMVPGVELLRLGELPGLTFRGPELPGGAQVTGTVTGTAAAVDADRMAPRAYGQLDNPTGLLREGMVIPITILPAK